MARQSRTFVCQSCGAVTPRWAGRCESCGEWNTIVEEAGAAGGVGAGPAAKSLQGKGRRIELVEMSGESAEPPRYVTGVGEFDRVTGGGLVPGSAVLVGGDPGIGKSTLLLQAMAALANKGHSVVYVSGEEAIAQVRMRARRLGLAEAPVQLGAETNLKDIIGTMEGQKAPDAVVIDSIQTMWADNLDSAPGTVSQVRASAQELVRFAKKNNTAIILVGHVTKEGQIAGPRVVEHMVDAVIYFEGERGHQFRVLRAVKNRFGPANEIGVFEMGEMGLAEVPNPSALFLGERDGGTSGSAVFAGIEGTRPVLVEIQALTAQSPLGTPRRAVVGWDSGRLSMVLAVLEARCGLSLAGQDVYLNVAGGLRINEPAADLAVAAALISSITGTPLPSDTVIFGEISLSGAVRPVSQMDARLKEAEKLGFARAILPAGAGKSRSGTGLKFTEISDLAGLIAHLAAAGQKGSNGRRSGDM
ncbi:DNA repair protein RadA [Parvibaculum sp.]|uniref:DNA repair protein RadA n=1 Tax=Parvibaculum sp. TaxID=2024848 RepID=UPI001B094318|nr:DNA repair protein RadA [Parvibaculum sp.]MBO6667404.1 DNA repair protein RadA [Parvibaculum sp.]MBO6692386.1 DNA repair protein RadA [Parvibaculum sp.]MBO6713956.1 DNA repair protein RadA [Parvibaculum sp.]